MTALTSRAVLLPLGDARLVGSLHVPRTVPQQLGVIFITGGMQTRAGSHRAFITLARSMASCGFAVLRFDLPGLGDSEGTLRAFEDNADALRAAIDFMLAEVPGTAEVMLWGLCDGASAAALYASDDPRVAALFLVNPWVHSGQVHAQAMVSGYYRQRLLSGEFWRKLLSGKVGIWRSACEYVSAWRQSRKAAGSDGNMLPQRVLGALRGYGGQLQILISGQDLTGQAFLRASSDGEGLPVSVLDDADHTFSSAISRAQLEAMSLVFLETVVVQAAKRGA